MDGCRVRGSTRSLHMPSTDYCQRLFVHVGSLSFVSIHCSLANCGHGASHLIFRLCNPANLISVSWSQPS
ncbi:hypothetical protein BKA80DRAFT_108706 [Phyllosticta citrichinensis]